MEYLRAYGSSLLASQHGHSLTGFAEITLSVLQTRDALARCAFEAFELCHEVARRVGSARLKPRTNVLQDGITYAEARFSPVLHLQRGLSLEDVMQSVEVGRQRAERELGIRGECTRQPPCMLSALTV